MSPHQLLLAAMEARKEARFALHSGLPGRLIYFRAAMRRAIRKWRQYAEMTRSAS